MSATTSDRALPLTLRLDQNLVDRIKVFQQKCQVDFGPGIKVTFTDAVRMVLLEGLRHLNMK